MSKYPGVERLPSGKIKYRGTTFAGFNKPRRSNRPEKKGMVLAKKGDKQSFAFPIASPKGYNVSYSGIKTAFMNFIKIEETKNPDWFGYKRIDKI